MVVDSLLLFSPGVSLKLSTHWAVVVLRTGFTTRRQTLPSGHLSWPQGPVLVTGGGVVELRMGLGSGKTTGNLGTR